MADLRQHFVMSGVGVGGNGKAAVAVGLVSFFVHDLLNNRHAVGVFMRGVNPLRLIAVLLSAILLVVRLASPSKPAEDPQSDLEKYAHTVIRNARLVKLQKESLERNDGRDQAIALPTTGGTKREEFKEICDNIAQENGIAAPDGDDAPVARALPGAPVVSIANTVMRDFAGMPTNTVFLERHDQAAALVITFPLTDGGSPLTHFTVRCSPGGMEQRADVPADGVGNHGGELRLLFGGLTNGTAYTFTATASSAATAATARACSSCPRCVALRSNGCAGVCLGLSARV